MSNSARGSGVFGSEERDQNFLSKTTIMNPGPGSYTPSHMATLKRIPPSFGFGSSSRERSTFAQMGKDSPGPNLYAKPPIVGKDGPSVSFIPRRSGSSHQKHRDNPGPGSYDPMLDGSRSTGPQAVFSAAKRSQLSKEALQRPAPNNYYPKDTTSKRKNNPRSVFGSSKRLFSTTTSFAPGPGTYDKPEEKQIGPLLGGKRVEVKQDNFPGPGSYSPNTSLINRETHGHKVGVSPRDRGVPKPGAPGPGAYDTSYDMKKNGGGVSIGTGKRGFLRQNSNPGPGAYRIPVKLAETPEYLIPGKPDSVKFV